MSKALQATADDIAGELYKLGFANMADYIRVTPDGDPYIDLSELTRDQAAAVAEITVDEYVVGRGENARDVRKVKAKLADKRAALVDLAKLLGYYGEHIIVQAVERAKPELFDALNAARELPEDTPLEGLIDFLLQRLGGGAGESEQVH